MANLVITGADNSIGTFNELMPNFLIRQTNPLNPFPGKIITVAVDPVDVPRASQESKQDSFRAVAGVRGLMDLFGGHEYHWSADASWDLNSTKAETTLYSLFLGAAITAGLYNPLRDLTNAPMISQSQQNSLRNVFDSFARPQIIATNWRANGDLFETWAGEAGISVGAEYRRQFQNNRANYSYGDYINTLPGLSFLAQPNSITQNVRDTYAGYVELDIPLIDGLNHVPLVEKLELSSAVRYEKYDDFAAAKPPMAALKWTVVPGIALRAQYSQGFQPPTLDQLHSPAVSNGPFGVPITLSYVDPLRPGLPNTDACFSRPAAIRIFVRRPPKRGTWE